MVAQPVDIVITTQNNQLSTEVRNHVDLRYLKYFDHNLAVQQVMEHVAKLGSSRRTTRHTERAYMPGLDYYFKWSGLNLPTANLINSYIAHLISKDLKHTTINSKYLAPLRHYLGKLASQHIDAQQFIDRPIMTEGQDRLEFMQLVNTRALAVNELRSYIEDCKQHIMDAKSVKSAKPQHTSNLSPLWQHGIRLSRDQMNALLRQIPRDTVMGLRNYAFMRIAFESAFRIAEMAGITLKKITPYNDHYLVTVLGKRNNIDPVAISSEAVAALQKYVDAYNAQLPADDPRRILEDTPVWQPLTRSSNLVEDCDPAEGMSKNALSHIVKKTSERVLGKGKGMAAHDTRRTYAAVAYNAGVPVPVISAHMRHKDVSTTWAYIGKPPNYDNNLLTKYVKLA